MAITLTTAPPGGGKSYDATADVIQELRTTRRLIVTNLKLDLAEMQIKLDSRGWTQPGRPRRHVYFRMQDGMVDRIKMHLRGEHFPTDEKEVVQEIPSRRERIDVRHRVFLLTASQCYFFWRYRGRVYLNFAPEEKMVEGRRQWIFPPRHLPDDDPGIRWKVDEAHSYFNSREWMHTGVECLEIISKHEHDGDDMDFYTQHPDRLDKQIKDLAEEFAHVTNLERGTVGWFRRGRGFMKRSAPTLIKPGQKTLGERISYRRLDKQFIGACYRSEASQTNKNRIVGRSNVRKGWGPKIWIVLIILAICFLNYAPDWFMNRLDAMGMSFAGHKAKPSAAKGVSPSPAPPPQMQHMPVAPPPFSGARSVPVPVAPGVLRSWTYVGGHVEFTLGDGRVLPDEKGMVFDGKTLLWHGQRFVSP